MGHSWLGRIRIRRGRSRRGVIKNSIAIFTGDDFVAATHLGHRLRPQRHEAGHARAVARFSYGNAIANARADAVVVLHPLPWATH